MPLFKRTTYFFVYHGSRDARSGRSARQLAHRMMDVLAEKPLPMRAIAQPNSAYSFSGSSAQAYGAEVYGAEADDAEADGDEHGFYKVGALELAEISLHEQLARFGKTAKQRGFHTVCVIPLFLLPGTHVREDIPEEVSRAQRVLGRDIRLTLCPHVGSHADIAEYLKAKCTQRTQQPSKTARVFVNHGSKRPRANEPVEAIAHTLDATIAYWSMPPSLETCLDELIAAGFRDIIVIPYFLFAGKITDAIAQTVQDYHHRFPHVRIHTEQPIGEDVAIAPLFANLVQSHGANSRATLV
jgi:sirohydrochlorin ferrochelatase